MSYCRPPDADIYLYPAGEHAVHCQLCSLCQMHVIVPRPPHIVTWWGTFRAESREEAFWHVVAHIENGDACGSALHRLYEEATAALSLG